MRLGGRLGTVDGWPCRVGPGPGHAAGRPRPERQRRRHGHSASATGRPSGRGPCRIPFAGSVPALAGCDPPAFQVQHSKRWSATPILSWFDKIPSSHCMLTFGSDLNQVNQILSTLLRLIEFKNRLKLLGFYLVLHGWMDFYRLLLNFNGFSWVLHVFPEFQVLLQN